MKIFGWQCYAGVIIFGWQFKARMKIFGCQCYAGVNIFGWEFYAGVGICGWRFAATREDDFLGICSVLDSGGGYVNGSIWVVDLSIGGYSFGGIFWICVVVVLGWLCACCSFASLFVCILA